MFYRSRRRNLCGQKLSPMSIFFARGQFQIILRTHLKGRNFADCGKFWLILCALSRRIEYTGLFFASILSSLGMYYTMLFLFVQDYYIRSVMVEPLWGFYLLLTLSTFTFIFKLIQVSLDF